MLKKIEHEQITIDIPQRTERTNWVTMPLPDRRSLGRFAGWAFGRILLTSIKFTISSSRLIFKLGIYCCDSLDKGLTKLLNVYDAMPLMGVPLQSVVTEVHQQGTLSVVSIDILQAINGKHCFIIGDTGTGKSTLAQWLANVVGGKVTVYDADAAPDEWQGLQVIGRGGNFEAIAAAMSEDLTELQRRIELRGEQGDKALMGLDSVLIAEEFPLLADEIEIAPNWLIKHARRGRKPKRFIIALSQDDSVKALHIDGEGGVRKNFRYIRLGKFAVNHAKSLKNDGLMQWLQEGKYRCMVDDEPCQLPDLSGYSQLTLRLIPNVENAPTVTAVTATQQALQPLPPPQNPDELALKKAVKALKIAGWSDSKIIKDVLNYQGAKFNEGKEILQNLIDE